MYPITSRIHMRCVGERDLDPFHQPMIGPQLAVNRRQDFLDFNRRVLLYTGRRLLRAFHKLQPQSLICIVAFHNL